MKKALLAVVVVLVAVGMATAQTGLKKKRPLPYEFGRVVLNNYSQKAGLAPVVFDHWLHRSKFTCTSLPRGHRLCHESRSHGH